MIPSALIGENIISLKKPAHGRWVLFSFVLAGWLLLGATRSHADCSNPNGGACAVDADCGGCGPVFDGHQACHDNGDVCFCDSSTCTGPHYGCNRNTGGCERNPDGPFDKDPSCGNSCAPPPPTCTGCQSLSNNKCVDDNTKCSGGQVCSGGSCVNPPLFRWTGGCGSCVQDNANCSLGNPTCSTRSDCSDITCCVPNGSCDAPTPACGQTTTGKDNCGNACSKTGPACCVPNGSCDAPTPACGQTTTGKDNCGNACTKTGPTCGCVPNGSCSAPTPACGQTTTGQDNCGNACSKTGPVCPPAITSAGTANGTAGASFSYQIVASNSPTSFSASGLPANLTVNPTNGLISGIPAAAGTSNVTLGATNTGGTGNKTLTLTIAAAPPGAPQITSPLTANALVGKPFSYQIVATNNPVSYSASGLPTGLSVNTTSGLISGTPTTAGNSTVVLGASNGTAAGLANLALTVAVEAGPALTSIRVMPTGITIAKDKNQKFTALGFDQFENPFPLGTITWSASGGNVTGAGEFRSAITGKSIRITATVTTPNGPVSGTALVTVFQSALDNAYAWPVPFKPSQGHTAINFVGLGDDTTIKIFTTAGELVKELHSAAGQTTISWTPVNNNDGEPLASGVYVYQLKNPYSEKRGKLVVIR